MTVGQTLRGNIRKMTRGSKSRRMGLIARRKWADGFGWGVLFGVAVLWGGQELVRLVLR